MDSTGARIRNLRRHANLSLEDFAQEVGSTAIEILHYERNDIYPSATTLQSIADFFGAGLEYFTEPTKFTLSPKHKRSAYRHELEFLILTMDKVRVFQEKHSRSYRAYLEAKSSLSFGARLNENFYVTNTLERKRTLMPLDSVFFLWDEYVLPAILDFGEYIGGFWLTEGIHSAKEQTIFNLTEVIPQSLSEKEQALDSSIRRYVAALAPEERPRYLNYFSLLRASTIESGKYFYLFGFSWMHSQMGKLPLSTNDSLLKQAYMGVLSSNDYAATSTSMDDELAQMKQELSF